MRKLLTALFAVALLITATTSSANAISSSAGIASGTWMGSGEVVPVDLTGTSFPAWLQLADYAGFKADVEQQVCHPFPGGQFGWVADIRVLDGKQWVPVPTTQGWEPDEEGTYLTCANVSNWGGTYALFAYYVKPVNITEELPKCDFSTFVYFDQHPLIFTTGDPYTGWWFEAVLDGIPIADGTPVSYKIVDSSNLPGIIPTTASGIVETYTDNPDIKGVLFFEVSEPPIEPWSAVFRLTFPTCFIETVYVNGGF